MQRLFGPSGCTSGYAQSNSCAEAPQITDEAPQITKKTAAAQTRPTEHVRPEGSCSHFA